MAAPSALFIGWGPVITGRETVSFAVFAEAIQYFAGLQQRGEIDNFEPIALEWHGGELAGFLLIRGDASKLQQLRYSDEFTRLISRGASVVQDFVSAQRSPWRMSRPRRDSVSSSFMATGVRS
jgi:hypothetical protein